MKINIIDMIAKPENIWNKLDKSWHKFTDSPEKATNKLDKSLEEFSPFTSVPDVVLTITKKQKLVVLYAPFCPAI